MHHFVSGPRRGHLDGTDGIRCYNQRSTGLSLLIAHCWAMYCHPSRTQMRQAAARPMGEVHPPSPTSVAHLFASRVVGSASVTVSCQCAYLHSPCPLATLCGPHPPPRRVQYHAAACPTYYQSAAQRAYFERSNQGYTAFQAKLSLPSSPSMRSPLATCRQASPARVLLFSI